MSEFYYKEFGISSNHGRKHVKVSRVLVLGDTFHVISLELLDTSDADETGDSLDISLKIVSTIMVSTYKMFIVFCDNTSVNDY